MLEKNTMVLLEIEKFSMAVPTIDSIRNEEFQRKVSVGNITDALLQMVPVDKLNDFLELEYEQKRKLGKQWIYLSAKADGVELQMEDEE